MQEVLKLLGKIVFFVYNNLKWVNKNNLVIGDV